MLRRHIYKKKQKEVINIMKRLAVLLLSILLVVSLMAGCAGKKDTAGDTSTGTGTTTTTPSTSGGKTTTTSGDDIVVSEKGVLPIVNKKIDITVFTADNPSVENFETNKLTLFLEEQTNIHVIWQLVAAKDRDQKLNLMLASSEKLPDVIMGGMDNAVLVEYASQGSFIPLNDLIEKHSVYLVQLFAEYDGLENMITAPDGNIYSLPNITMSIPNSYPRRMWINKVWLDTLGLDMPETTEEFKEVLRAFKYQDPNGNGKQDEIPMMGATNGWHTTFDRFLMNSFIKYNESFPYNLDNGKVTAVYDKEEYREGLRYLKSLVDEGLYDPVSFTQDADQLRQIFENEEIHIVGCIPGGMPTANMAGDRYKQLTAVPPLEGPNGVRWANHEPWNYILYQNVMVITKDCQYPDAVFKWGDYQYDTDVSMRARLGEPGVDWVEAAPGTVDLEGNPALFRPILLWGPVQNSHWYQRHPSHENFADKGERSDDPYELQRLLWEATFNCYKPYTPPMDMYVPDKMLYSAEDSKRMNEINSVLRTYVNECRDKFITGVMDLDKDWDTYLNELKKIGYEEYIEIIQRRYEQFLAD